VVPLKSSYIAPGKILHRSELHKPKIQPLDAFAKIFTNKLPYRQQLTLS